MIKKLKKKFLNISLKKKFIILIAGIATISPIFLIGILSLIYYYIGIESLFNDQVSKAVSDTVNVARLYLKENNEKIKFELLQIEKIIERQIKVIDESTELNQILEEQVRSSSISEAIIFTKDGVIARSSLSFSLISQIQKITPEDYNKIYEEKVVLLENQDGDKIRAITKLDSIFRSDVYLLIGKFIDKEIVDYLKKTQDSKNKYYYLLADLKFTKRNLQIAFIIISSLMCLFSFIISVKLGNIIANPLNKLLNATSKIKLGDYSIRVPEKNSEDEVSQLAKAFNKMTQTIEAQHNQIKAAYKNIDERVKFIETVLKEISSGVIALDSSGYISLYNNSAKKLLNLEDNNLNQHISKIIPEINLLINNLLNAPQDILNENLIIKRKGKSIHLFIKIGAVIIENKIKNIVISFEDITQLVSAQREAAWSDVAKRIAHEIKNPITPIQLSAERLQSKFANLIEKKHLKNYNKYINTIIRNVNDIHSIVSEFIQFARIPKPKLASYNINEIINEVIFSQKNIYKEIKYSFDYNIQNNNVYCDKTQITQVLTNIVKNSAESIISSDNNKGTIKIKIEKVNDEHIKIIIEDNGGGINTDLIDKITEPYITTKNTGMGLGLSIVKKILEDHESKLHLSNTKDGLRIYFNLKTNKKNDV
ncbi:ATP-binding protein [Rickettsiales endosymbiont of Trichoplax sp. H2]|uniref:ATP-binding protein n=1 Tax=Rickettsiales endosymbiont of Trichoplax sp. H2 TaxID=2021221 RepID=UPI0012B3E0A3|nr:ATP-binding protein [Rickettsiales endosymbiont of Trichoplax sp. H2]MSO13348.1 Nitrogen regulation protein NtrY [Rickettsiales endosymbiont of Trichoplax sp. H2]